MDYRLLYIVKYFQLIPGILTQQTGDETLNRRRCNKPGAICLRKFLYNGQQENNTLLCQIRLLALRKTFIVSPQVCCVISGSVCQDT